MNRYFILAALAVGAASSLRGSLLVDPQVNLQPATPGTQQVGNINVSGAILGGSVSAQHNIQAVFGRATAAAGVTSGGYFVGDSSNSRAVYGRANSANGFNFGGYFESPSSDGQGVFGDVSSAAGLTNGVHGRSASTAGRGVYGESTAAGGASFGVYGRNTSNAGIGVFGVDTSPSGTTYGVYGRAMSPSGFGVYSDGNLAASGIISGNGSGLTGVDAATIDGLDSTAFLQHVPVPLVLSSGVPEAVIKATTHSSVIDSAAIKGVASGAAATHGVMGESTVPAGRGVYGRSSTSSGSSYGVYGLTLSTEGVGVLGTATASSGLNYGGRFSTLSTSGRAISAVAAAQSGTTYGVFGESLSDQGTGVFGRTADNVGVFGIATGDTGVNFGGSFQSNSSSGRAVYGLAGANAGTNYGVRGFCASPTGYAVFAAGDSGASGTKSFRIDHPSDPQNKYLLHYSAESPTPQNFYVGNVVTDAKGYAWVQLPDYFQEINANFKYQLTVVDDQNSDSFVMAKVSKKIRGNRFQIRTNAPHVEVSWEVKADRNDLYVQRKHPRDVIEKEGPERGKYQHPELYGLGPERGMDYDPRAPSGEPISPPRK